MAIMTQAQTDAELLRKKNLGIPPTSAANNSAYAALTPQKTATPITPVSANTAASQTAAATYISNNGGSAAYIANQQQKLGVAQSNNDTDMLARLKADEARTGFSYAPTAQPVIQSDGTSIDRSLLGGGTPTPGPAPVTETQTATPMSASQANSQPAPDYAALAAARTALALQQKTTIANQQKTAAQTSYDQQNLRTKDNRVLGDFSRTQTANPFGNMGKTSFQEGLIGRERTQADADASTALATQKGNIDALLADYQNATAEEQVRIADELERADRSYKLDLAKFEQDQANYNKTFDQNQQQIDYSQSPNNPSNIGQGLSNYGQTLQNSLSELKLGNYSTEVKQQAALYEQELKTGKMTQEAAEYNLKELKDPKSATNQAKALDLQMKQLEAKNLPETERLKLQQLKKEIAQIGVVHYKPQTANEKAMDEANLKILQNKVDNLGNPEPLTGAEANNQYTSEVVTNVDAMTPENRKMFFTNEKAALIKKLGKSVYDNLYNDYYDENGDPK